MMHYLLSPGPVVKNLAAVGVVPMIRP